MESVKQFIVSNYQFIVLAVVALIEIVIALCKRRTKAFIYDDSATNELIGYIKEAEDKIGAGHGEEKLQYVLNLYFQKHPNLAPYSKAVVNLIEHILSSPQKKG